MPAPKFLSGLPKPVLFGLYGAIGGLIGALAFGEPLWRALNLARGRYWRTLGNTPGHLQHWSTPALLALLQQHVEVMALRTPLPWTMALCRARERGPGR